MSELDRIAKILRDKASDESVDNAAKDETLHPNTRKLAKQIQAERKAKKEKK